MISRAREISEQQFEQLGVQALRGEVPVVLAAVENEPELVTRGDERHGMTFASLGLLWGSS